LFKRGYNFWRKLKGYMKNCILLLMKKETNSGKLSSKKIEFFLIKEGMN